MMQFDNHSLNFKKNVTLSHLKSIINFKFIIVVKHKLNNFASEKIFFEQQFFYHLRISPGKKYQAND